LSASSKHARDAAALPLYAAWLVFSFANCALADESAAAGAVRVARWKDDKAAAFLLMFDDSWPSHWQVAAPELVKRGMTATFYICPGKGEHQKFAKQWDEILWQQGMIYGDHTMTHKGVKDLANAESEIGECARIIRQITWSKEERLVSYGQPGVGPDDWNLTAEQLDALLKKHRLISRPTFVGHGAVYHLKTAEEMLALADRAIAKNGMEYLVIHGVERITPDWGYQDMWPLKQAVFLAVLNGLQERRDRGALWITDHISMHQYETERSTAAVRVLESNDRGIRIELKSQADPRYYDLPLTLVARVPADWKSARVTQGAKATLVPAENGAIRFDALPGADPINVERIVPG
jgi:peptidoglycan/xylan/chitin deacetylase (PgdA/CDA1 family)